MLKTSRTVTADVLVIGGGGAACTAAVAAARAGASGVLVSKGKAGIGMGPGQPNRVDSALLACERAEDFCEREGVEKGGFACASDAFFPFRDNVDVLAAHGVTCIIQPGGSKRDDESIQACNEHNIAMVFTGARHFRH